MRSERIFLEKAIQLGDLADKAADPRLAESLRRRAREWRALAAEVQIFQKDPVYRQIHDRPY